MTATDLRRREADKRHRPDRVGAILELIDRALADLEPPTSTQPG